MPAETASLYDRLLAKYKLKHSHLMAWAIDTSYEIDSKGYAEASASTDDVARQISLQAIIPNPYQFDFSGALETPDRIYIRTPSWKRFFEAGQHGAALLIRLAEGKPTTLLLDSSWANNRAQLKRETFIALTDFFREVQRTSKSGAPLTVLEFGGSRDVPIFCISSPKFMACVPDAVHEALKRGLLYADGNTKRTFAWAYHGVLEFLSGKINRIDEVVYAPDPSAALGTRFHIID